MYINIRLGSKESSETPFHQATVFHSRQVDVPAEKFRQHLLLSNVIFLPSEQSLQHVYTFVYPYRGIPLTVQNLRTQRDTLVSTHLVVFLFVGTKLITTSITLTLT
jgi:hypothetical protein